MLYFIKFIYSVFLLPPGVFIIAFAILAIKCYQKQRLIALCLLGLTFLLYLCSISLVSNILISPLENTYRLPAQVSGDVLVMLGGGATLDTPNLDGRGHLSPVTANRLLTCAQLYHQLHLPIILSGGQVYQTTGYEARIAAKILQGLGVPRDKILIEDDSLNTTQNAGFVKKILSQHNFGKPILITSAFHLPRAVLEFKKTGTAVTPYPADYHTNVSFRFSSRQLIPSAEALNEVSIALKEYLGLLFVKCR